MTRLRLGVLSSHPIQYQAPLFRELARRLDLTVYYAHRQTPQAQADAGFGVPFDWDVDLLSGYEHRFLDNVAPRPDVSSFFGCDTPQVAEELDRTRFDAFLVMGWYLKAYWQAIRACRRLRVPVMVRGDSQLSNGQRFPRRWAKAAIYPMMLRQFDVCLFVGQRHLEYLRHYGVPEDRLVFSPHCVDNDWFAREASQVQQAGARAALELEAADRVVLFVGKLVSRKRPLDLVHALSMLNRDGYRIVGLFAGDGPLRTHVEGLGKKSDVPIRCLGFRNQSELPSLYVAADILVLPSDATETWGLVVNEALACGTRAVASESVGCGPDLLGAIETGLTYPVGDIRALAAAIGRVFAADIDRDGIRRLISKYSVSAAADGVEAAIARLRCRDAH